MLSILWIVIIPCSNWNLCKKGRYPLSQYWSSEGKRNRLPKLSSLNAPNTETSFYCSHFGALTIQVWKISYSNLNKFWIYKRFDFCFSWLGKNFFWFVITAVDISFFNISPSYQFLTQILFESELIFKQNWTVGLNLGAVWMNVWNLIQNWNLVLTPQINQCDFKP